MLPREIFGREILKYSVMLYEVHIRSTWYIHTICIYIITHKYIHDTHKQHVFRTALDGTLVLDKIPLGITVDGCVLVDDQP